MNTRMVLQTFNKTKKTKTGCQPVCEFSNWLLFNQICRSQGVFKSLHCTAWKPWNVEKVSLSRIFLWELCPFESPTPTPSPCNNFGAVCVCLTRSICLNSDQSQEAQATVACSLMLLFVASGLLGTPWLKESCCGSNHWALTPAACCLPPPLYFSALANSILMTRLTRNTHNNNNNTGQPENKYLVGTQMKLHSNTAGNVQLRQTFGGGSCGGVRGDNHHFAMVQAA